MDISKTFPRKLELTLKDCESSKEFREFKKNNPELVNAMLRLEGVIDHITTHAAGILIAPKPISDLCPVIYDHKEQISVVGYDKYTLDELNFYKFDILALSTLTIIDNCIKLLQKRGINIDFNSISRSDSNVYDQLCAGNVFGVFQLAEQSDITQKTQPKQFSDITALNAIVRPGTCDVNEYIARRNGKEFNYYSDAERSYMEQTNNMIIYQEQFMLRANTLSTLTLGQGDSLRKNKHIETDIDLKNKYLEGCKTKGLVDEEQAEQSWNDIVESVSGGYNFNASHACCYADIAYQTAWLKYYHPIEFMCALMTQERGDKEMLMRCVTHCKQQMHIEILPPHINKSKEEFTIEHNTIRYSLHALDGIGEEALKNILSLQPVQSFDDFLERADLRICNKTVVTNLIKSGCFDDFNLNRVELLNQYATQKKDKKLLSEYAQLVYNNNVKTKFEKDVLTFYLTSSPYERFGFKELSKFEEGDTCVVGGEITKIKQITDKNKRPMAFLTITNQHETFESTIFATEYKQYESLLSLENIIIITGKKQNNKILVNKITKIME